MDISIRQGESLILSSTNDDLTAQTLQLIVENQAGNIVINKSANFTTTDGVRGAEIVVDPSVTYALPITDDSVSYKYMLKITYADGTVEIQPSVDDCEDCDLPELKICEALGVS